LVALLLVSWFLLRSVEAAPLKMSVFHDESALP